MNKKYFFLSLLIAGTILQGISQTKLNIGGAYFGDALTNPGVMVELERETYFSKDFSLPLRANVGFFSTKEFNSFLLDIHKGFRKYHKSGFFWEQSVGIGVIANYYTHDNFWFIDNLSNVVKLKKGANLGFSPSITIGGGYNISKKEGTQHLIWIRPKIYWNFGIRGLHLPYAALQIGYSYNLKSKS